jgi:tetratricopeptide (TPR) repeat protein
MYTGTTIMRRLVSVVVLLVGLAMGAAPAAAQKSYDKGEVKRAYDEGTKYFSLGNFPKAIEFYTRAFELKPDPVFLYNIAQCHRLAGDLAQALFFYKSYLRSAPKAANRAEVEGRIGDIETTLASQREAASKPPNDSLEPGAKAGNLEPRSSATPPRAPAAAAAPTAAAAAARPALPAEDRASATTMASDSESSSLPLPEQVARNQEAKTPAAVDLQAAPAAPRESRSLLTRWWFWTGVAAVAAAAVTVTLVATRQSGHSAPAGDFPTQPVF